MSIAVITRTEVLMERGTEIGPEVNDKALIDFPAEFLDVVITNKAWAGKTLKELATSEFTRGVFLKKLVRAGQQMPFTAETRLDRGDLMSLVGAKHDVERAAKEIGYADRPTITTDMIFVGLGIFFGGLVGLLTVTIGGLPITLTASGGALIMGLVFGYLRSVRPTFGRIPEPAMWVFDTVGLTTFMAVVGLSAGPSFVAGLQKSGPSLIVVGLDSSRAAPPHVDSVRAVCVKDEPPDPPRRLLGGRDHYCSASCRPGRGAEQAPGSGLYRTLCHWQHPADGMGTGDCGHDGISKEFL